MNGLLANKKYFVPAIDHPDPNKLGLIVAGYTLGGLPGLFPASWVADNLGRRLALTIGCLIIVAGGLVQARTTGAWKMFAGRFVVGMGGAFCSISGSTYAAEIAHPRNRSQVGALINTCWCVWLGGNAVVKLPHVRSAWRPASTLVPDYSLNLPFYSKEG